MERPVNENRLSAVIRKLAVKRARPEMQLYRSTIISAKLLPAGIIGSTCSL
jgi:hypothetical protein